MDLLSKEDFSFKKKLLFHTLNQTKMESKNTQKVMLELELPSDKLEALKPMIKEGKIKIVLGKNSFVACNAAFVACNAAFTENRAAFIACNAAFTK